MARRHSIELSWVVFQVLEEGTELDPRVAKHIWVRCAAAMNLLYAVRHHTFPVLPGEGYGGQRHSLLVANLHSVACGSSLRWLAAVNCILRSKNTMMKIHAACTATLNIREEVRM